MPKITRHGGVSNKALREHARNLVEPDFSESLARLEAEGGEQPSAGNSGETSSGKPSTPPVTSETVPRKRARKTANRSAKGQTETSTAPSTAGAQEGAASATDAAADEGGAA